MRNAIKVLVYKAFRCVGWYIWCAQFLSFVNLCDFSFILVNSVPILSPVILIYGCMIMNKKCFCCFENMCNNLNEDDDLLQDWLDFRFEELETNLSDEDKSHFLKFDDFYDKIIDVTLDTKKDYVSNVLNDLRDDFMQYCIYWNEKYYKTGFSDGVKLLDKALNS